MFVFGRIIGAALGWLVGGVVGAVAGFCVGYFFDKALASFQSHFNPEKRAQVELALFNTIFPLLGHMAKSDGRVSEEEVQATELLMGRMQLSTEQRQEAIRLFKLGSSPDFQLEQSLKDFNQACGMYADVKQILLVYLISLAMADGHLHEAEKQVLREVAKQLGYSEQAYEHFLKMAQAQGHFYQGQGQSHEDELKLAYETLGVEKSMGDAEIKRAYRKLMSQYHPDKLVGQGVPEHMVKVATERSQEIQRAYDLVKKSRAQN